MKSDGYVCKGVLVCGGMCVSVCALEQCGVSKLSKFLCYTWNTA